MNKEGLNPEPAPDDSKEPNGEEQPPVSKPEGDPDNVFDSPNKTVLPPATREDAINRGDIKVPPVGTRRGSNLGAYDEKGRRARRARRGKKE